MKQALGYYQGKGVEYLFYSPNQANTSEAFEESKEARPKMNGLLSCRGNY
jgi:hypothetical protein